MEKLEEIFKNHITNENKIWKYTNQKSHFVFVEKKLIQIKSFDDQKKFDQKIKPEESKKEVENYFTFTQAKSNQKGVWTNFLSFFFK